ncbi:hypothetical protein GDO86_015996 [Hymenochirus boettgeri]|uniref:THAP-type domain-containing protein n=1 Tax=Hymenochirus boettgeri TaxID=247094 RepID=A0A8T2JXQ8_9PIPI|nr:hypothetical protein GDO86_015996 [Hymenochirus boettgeri]
MAAYHCCVPFCNSDSRYNADKKISFHRIPAFHVEPQRHRDWLNRIRREPGPTFKVSSCTRVCSKHFHPSDFVRTLTGKRNLKPTSVPCIFQWTNSEEMETPIPKRNSKNTLQPILPTQLQTPKTKPFTAAERTVSVLDHCYDLPPKTDTEMLHAAREEIARLQQCNSTLERNRFFVERFSKDSSLINFYTGFKDYNTLTDVFTTFTQTEGNMLKWRQCQKGNICVAEDSVSEQESMLFIDQFFLFLCKVRQGYFDQDLAVRFNISQSRVNRIILSWAKYLYLVLGEIPLWRSKAVGNQGVPDCFKASYPHARVILHCAEFKVQTSNPSVTSQLYTYYHNQTTYKGLLGIAPHGAVIFISPLYSSCASKRDITKSSGILDLLETDDLVITDKDFNIQDLVEAVGAFLVIPPVITTAGSAEECGEATVMVTQSTEEQNTMIILAPSVEDQETLVVSNSVALEDAVVELDHSAEEVEVEVVVSGENAVLGHSTSVETEHGHPIVETTNLKPSPKEDEAMKIEHYTREEVVISIQEPEKGGGESAVLESEINTLARLRICVDQDIERVRQYHIFDKVLPVTLEGAANQIWAVCAMLTNINGSLS